MVGVTTTTTTMMMMMTLTMLIANVNVNDNGNLEYVRNEDFELLKMFALEFHFILFKIKNK